VRAGQGNRKKELFSRERKLDFPNPLYHVLRFASLAQRCRRFQRGVSYESQVCEHDGLDPLGGRRRLAGERDALH
jgi:hypothetical protein